MAKLLVVVEGTYGKGKELRPQENALKTLKVQMEKELGMIEIDFFSGDLNACLEKLTHYFKASMIVLHNTTFENLADLRKVQRVYAGLIFRWQDADNAEILKNIKSAIMDYIFVNQK
jgi:hypothetical protein